MKKTYPVVMAAVMHGLALTLNAGDVRIEKAEHVYSVTADRYTAKVNGEGALTSLAVRRPS